VIIGVSSYVVAAISPPDRHLSRRNIAGPALIVIPGWPSPNPEPMNTDEARMAKAGVPGFPLSRDDKKKAGIIGLHRG
jgi:hypothetical protein